MALAVLSFRFQLSSSPGTYLDAKFRHSNTMRRVHFYVVLVVQQVRFKIRNEPGTYLYVYFR